MASLVRGDGTTSADDVTTSSDEVTPASKGVTPTIDDGTPTSDDGTPTFNDVIPLIIARNDLNVKEMCRLSCVARALKEMLKPELTFSVVLMYRVKVLKDRQESLFSRSCKAEGHLERFMHTLDYDKLDKVRALYRRFPSFPAYMFVARKEAMEHISKQHDVLRLLHILRQLAKGGQDGLLEIATPFQDGLPKRAPKWLHCDFGNLKCKEIIERGGEAWIKECVRILDGDERTVGALEQHFKTLVAPFADIHTVRNLKVKNIRTAQA